MMIGAQYPLPGNRASFKHEGRALNGTITRLEIDQALGVYLFLKIDKNIWGVRRQIFKLQTIDLIGWMEDCGTIMIGHPTRAIRTPLARGDRSLRDAD